MNVLVTDALWERLQPLLPPPPKRRFRFPGRKRLDYRKILTYILFVLKTGIAWDDLPAELGCGCGKTCRHILAALVAGRRLAPPARPVARRTQRGRSNRLAAGANRRLLRQGSRRGRGH